MATNGILTICGRAKKHRWIIFPFIRCKEKNSQQKTCNPESTEQYLYQYLLWKPTDNIGNYSNLLGNLQNNDRWVNSPVHVTC